MEDSSSCDVHIAAAQVRQLISAGADVSFRFAASNHLKARYGIGELRGSILVAAVSSGHDLIIEQIITAGANINAIGLCFADTCMEFRGDAATPLSRAIQAQNWRLTDNLLRAGAVVNGTPRVRPISSALFAAIESLNFDLFNDLLLRGARIDRALFMDLGSLMYGDLDPMSCENTQKLNAIMTRLLDELVLYETRENINDYTGPLFIAAIRHMPEVAKLLMERRLVNVNRMQGGRRPLYYALHGFPPCSTAKILLQSGVNPNLAISGINCRRQRTRLPLILATASNNTELVALLLKFGAQPDAMSHGCSLTTLHFATHLGNAIVVRVLLEHQANPDAQTRSQRDSPVEVVENEWISRLGSVEFSELPGLRINTPLQIASRNEHFGIAEMLIAIRSQCQ